MKFILGVFSSLYNNDEREQIIENICISIFKSCISLSNPSTHPDSLKVPYLKPSIKIIYGQYKIGNKSNLVFCILTL